jgi:hypothetical protein
MPNHVSIHLQVHQYCAGGINAVVDPAFHKMEAKLHTIKSANDAYSGRQLTFFSLEDRSVSGVELSSSLLEAIVQMNGASALVEGLSADLKIGTSIRHPKDESSESQHNNAMARALELTVVRASSNSASLR